jgi:hypothetical protein
MHTDPIPTAAPGGHRMRGPLGSGPQGDGRKPLPHVITSLLTLVLTLVVGHYSNILQGQQGRPGTTTVISKPVTLSGGLCVYVGPGSSISQRVQITTPKHDSSGPYCLKGKLVLIK